MTAKFLKQLLLSGFTQDQIHEIEEGLSEGLDVDFYANKSYLSIQMHQIRLGLQENLTVEYYAKPYYDWMQMEEIRKGLLDGLAVEQYANPSIPHGKMRQFRKGLKAGIDLSPYKHLNAGILRELRKSILSGVSLFPFIEQGYDAEQLNAIRHALEKNIAISPYLDMSYRDSSIREICLGLEHGLDVSLYASPAFTWQKMREIRLGMEHRLDVSTYADPLYSYGQMRELRLGLENHQDVSLYNSLMYTAREMNRIRLQNQMSTQKSSLEEELSIHKMDSYNIYINKNWTKVYIELTNLTEDISVDMISQSLRELGICYGINMTTIHNLVFKAYENQRVLIAEGTSAVAGADGWYEYFFQTVSPSIPLEFRDDSIDFQRFHWFQTVKKNQTLAIYHNAGEGIAGSTVTGQPLPAKRGNEKNILTGSGFKLLSDRRTYVAIEDGRVELKNEQLIVSKLLILDDLRSVQDSITFNGSILINCNVPSRLSIQASHDIIVNGCVESATIKCGGNILIKQGVHASETGCITAGKNIISTFFENAIVNAGENIQSLSFLHCNLYAKGFIMTLSSNGGIIGGRAYAEKGFHIHNAGNPAGVPTVLCLGINDELRENAHLLNEQIQEASKQFDILTNIHAEFDKKYSPAFRNAMETYLKIEKAIYTKRIQKENLAQCRKSLEQRIAAAENAQAVIECVLYENVIFKISNFTIDSKYMEHVTVSKDIDTIVITERIKNHA